MAATGITDSRPSMTAGVVVAMCFAVAIPEGYDLQAIGVAAPRLIPALHLAKAQTGWVFSASLFGLIIGAMVGGWLADRIGRKPVLIGSVAAFGVFSLATVLSNDFTSLFLWRLATGIGLGGAMPNLIAMAREISSPRRRALTSSMMFAAMPVGGAGAALYARYGAHSWGDIFVLGGIVPVALALLVAWKLPETRPSGDEAAFDRNTLTALFADGREGATLALWISFILTNIVVYLLLNWLPTLATAKGLGAASALFTSVGFNVGGIAGALLLAMAVDRMGLRGPLALGYAGLVAVMLALAAAHGFPLIVLLSAGSGFFVLGVQYVLYGMTPIYYAAETRAATAGAAVGVGRVGSILGPLVGGGLMSAGAGAGAVAFAMAPVALGAGAAAMLLTIVGRAYPD
jgi:MFS transporter, AAHS family, 3-hydroxyphenylpropionic acid transporter